MTAPPRFVLLEHDWPTPHLDLMLEAGMLLQSWRLATPLQPGPQSALATPPHRPVYLDYEGPVSGDRGHVRRLDQGTYTGSLADDAPFEVELTGSSLRGRLRFEPEEAPAHWLLHWIPHPPPKNYAP